MGSRASMLTGILPTAKRFVGDCRAEVDVPDAATLPETFRKAGYTTVSNGKIFHGKIDGWVAKKTIEDLRRLKQSGKPFFLACGFIRPHLPFYAPKKYWDFYPPGQIELADNRQRPENAPKELKGSGEFCSYHLGGLDEDSDDFHRMMRHGYLACTSYVDKLTGDVLAELDRLGLANNTIVVLWGDHCFHLAACLYRR